MSKLRLTIDELQVETFTAGTGGAIRGTVKARSYLSDVGGYGCSNPWCAGETTSPCQAATDAGYGCDSTQFQILCGCTAGPSACDVGCGRPTWNYEDTCQYGGNCPDYTHDAHCPTNPGYIGC